MPKQGSAHFSNADAATSTVDSTRRDSLRPGNQIGTAKTFKAARHSRELAVPQTRQGWAAAYRDAAHDNPRRNTLANYGFIHNHSRHEVTTMSPRAAAQGVQMSSQSSSNRSGMSDPASDDGSLLDQKQTLVQRSQQPQSAALVGLRQGLSSAAARQHSQEQATPSSSNDFFETMPDHGIKRVADKGPAQAGKVSRR